VTKVHLHYVKGHTISEECADVAYNSFLQHNWPVIKVEGYTPKNVMDTTAPFIQPLHKGRLYQKYAKEDREGLLVKLAVLANHMRFWQMVSEGDIPQIYAEHDVICVTDYHDLPDFEDVLVLNFDTELGVNHLFPQKIDQVDYPLLSDPDTWGAHPLHPNWPWMYSLENRYKGADLIPSAGCYALTPAGGRKLIDATYEGAEQGDLTINSFNVDIKVMYPKTVDYSRHNSKTSTTDLASSYVV